MSYIYIASPYSHPDPEVREWRFRSVCWYAGECLARGEDVFSPIAHTHPIAENHDLPAGWDFWKKIDTTMLRMARELRVLKLPGWEESVGVKEECVLATLLNLPITYVEWNRNDY
jgi:hypothetical protein